MAGTVFTANFNYKIIYVIAINDKSHEGLLKIGDATLHSSESIDKLPPNSESLNAAAHKRIREYTNTAGVEYTLLHTELAVKTETSQDGTHILKSFRDHDVHNVLKNSRIDNVTVGQATGKEWFRIDLATARKAIDAVKDNYKNISHTGDVAEMPVIFRPEQEECIKKAAGHFKKADKFLLNAKMRYGKTFVALEIVKRCNFQKTIIITHRPVVNAGWYDDFTKIFNGTEYVYGSKKNGYRAENLLQKGKPFVYFASVQDLRGSQNVGGKYNKNEAIFGTEWDCVIVDEAHEGTTTALGEETVAAVAKMEKGKTKFLALSGTPFNILDDYDEKSIYTWDYIMEQEQKAKWDAEHFGDSNPYEELPELKIYTYDLGQIIREDSYVSFEDKAFNFREFFRTWTGEVENDFEPMPVGATVGDFVHKQDIKSFLNLLTRIDTDSNYPFSREEYRELFHHTLWMVPGVAAAKALKAMMEKHPVFSTFDIVNVAGSDDEESKDALESVKKAINEAGDDGYTITISCGKLTTGVTVREWTGIFMLSGSYSTSAANYLQTIFRVQSPCNKNGKLKTAGYVFDFAPDRTLKMVADAVSVSTKAGKTNEGNKKELGKFLNYCSVIAINGSEMQEYSTGRLLQQLKKAYADRVVRSGFDDTRLYNDELLRLSDVDIDKFNNLRKIIGKNLANKDSNEITINDQGLTDEEREEKKKLEKRQKRHTLSSEDEARLAELKKSKKKRQDAIRILRAISIRMPLLIYGADIPYEEDIDLKRFVELVDEASWAEFMPQGVTKSLFREFQKYYDEEIFIASGRQIRNAAREADTLEPTERVMKVADIFRHFKNPDKETVLTPWRVVNLHMSTTVGGWDFYNDKHDKELDYPRWVEIPEVTRKIFSKSKARVLEINSKTGLYPLYVTYSLYREKLEHRHLNFAVKQKLWRQTVEENLFVICNTPMARAITKRTLLGFGKGEIRVKYYKDLVKTLDQEPQKFVKKVLDKRYWGDEQPMKFNAVVGNPPYMMMDGGAQASSKPIYQHFVEGAKKLSPEFASFIIPTRWYAGGKGLDDFRDAMLKDKHIRILHDCLTPDDVFPGTNIRGGVCWFLWDGNYDNGEGKVHVLTHENNAIVDDVHRSLKTEGYDIFVRDYHAVAILEKVKTKAKIFMSEHVSARRPFGFDGNVYKQKVFHKEEEEVVTPVKCYIKGMKHGFVDEEDVSRNNDWIDIYKVYTPYANNIGTELNDDNLNTFLGEPGSCCSESYIVVGADLNLDAERAGRLMKYFTTKTVRYLHSLAKSSQHATAKTYQYVPLEDFSDGSDIDWSQDIDGIDRQLAAKYGFTPEEAAYIGRKIKPMGETTAEVGEA